jgi:hypothetical protein
LVRRNATRSAVEPLLAKSESFINREKIVVEEKEEEEEKDIENESEA